MKKLLSPRVSPAASTSHNDYLEKRKQLFQRNLNQSITERRRLAQAQPHAPNPIKQYLDERGKLLERRISQLQAQEKKR